MARIKLFINSREPEIRELADKMRRFKIDFSSIPTSGPSVLWIDSRTCYGITAVKYAIRALLREKQSLLDIGLPRTFATVQRIC